MVVDSDSEAEHSESIFDSESEDSEDDILAGLSDGGDCPLERAPCMSASLYVPSDQSVEASSDAPEIRNENKDSGKVNFSNSFEQNRH